jgi:hypothetical protein
MRFIRLVFALFALTLIGLSQNNLKVSQNGDENEAILQQIGNNNALVEQFSEDIFNKVILQQLGSSNNALISQIQLGSGSGANIVEVVQDGLLNAVTIDQFGNGNFASVEQTGDNNSVDMMVEGQYNFSGIVQRGNGNLVIQDLTGVELNYVITQEGNNNQVTQVENGEQAKQYEITQIGDGIKIVIMNGPYLQ